VHRDTDSCDLERWKEAVKNDMLNGGDNDLLLGTGDWNDFMSTSERKRTKRSGLHETTISKLDKASKIDCDLMLDDLKGTEDKWIGVLRGNHHWFFETGELSGMESDEYYAKKLNCRFMGDLAYIRVRVNFKNHSQGAGNTIDIVACHGKAGGKLAGTTVNQVDDLRKIFPRADIYIMGHDHRRIAVPMSSLYIKNCPNGLRVKEHTQWLVRSGSFKRAYVEGQDNYEVGKYYPNSLGIVKIDCGFKRHRKDGDDIVTPDIHIAY